MYVGPPPTGDTAAEVPQPHANMYSILDEANHDEPPEISWKVKAPSLKGMAPTTKAPMPFKPLSKAEKKAEKKRDDKVLDELLAATKANDIVAAAGADGPVSDVVGPIMVGEPMGELVGGDAMGQTAGVAVAAPKPKKRKTKTKTKKKHKS